MKNISYNINPSNNPLSNVLSEISAKVIGVLKYNNSLREKIINRNIGSYALISDGEDGIGYISNLYSNETSKPLPLGAEGLLGYTHIHSSDYQTSINQKYDIGELISYYQSGSFPIKNYRKWQGRYDNYIDYINNTFGLEMSQLNFLAETLKKHTFGEQSDKPNKFLTIQSVLNDFLQYSNIGYAMEKERIGTVTPNPMAALNGAITTNINNFSGTDTQLGLITNTLYANTLRNAAQFNSLRRTNYITQGIYDGIGNKMSTLSLLNTNFKIDPDTGRLAHDFNTGAGVRTYESLDVDTFQSMDMVDYTRDIASSQNARYNNIISNMDRYMPFNGYRYEKKTTDGFPLLHSTLSPTLGKLITRTWHEGDKGRKFAHYLGKGDILSMGIETEFPLEEKLLSKTQELMQSHDENGIDTLIGRFHTSGGRDANHNEVGLFQTAVSKFGMSHGRNLLNKRAYQEQIATYENGYENPYCRTWTYHHQYANYGDTIRPMATKQYDGTYSVAGADTIQKDWWRYGRRKGSAGRLAYHSVLNKNNGMVNIAPSIQGLVDIKKCMFSIENLAWKGNVKGLSKEQIGPNDGRIMWFPPYDLRFNEQVGVTWNPVEFIGRGEKIYTYTNTERTGTLSFTLLMDHPSVLDMWKRNGKKGNDEFDNEQTLLRFFAGCEILEFDNKKITDEKVEVPKKEPEKEDKPIKEEKTSNVVFYVFFPNYYSGISDYEKDTKESFTEEALESIYDDVAGSPFTEGHIASVFEYISNEYESNNKNKKPYLVYKDKEWEYRVDYKFVDKKLTNTANYKDSDNYFLNEKLDNVTSNNNFNDASFSFNSIYTISGASRLADAINKRGGRKITSIEIKGYASNQGHTDENDTLSSNRAKMVQAWLRHDLSGYLGFDGSQIKTCTSGGEIEVDAAEKDTVSGKSAKLARCVRVCINFAAVDTLKSSKDLTTSVSNKATVVNENNPRLNSGDSSLILTKKQKRIQKKRSKEDLREQRKQDRIEERQQRKTDRAELKELRKEGRISERELRKLEREESREYKKMTRKYRKEHGSEIRDLQKELKEKLKDGTHDRIEAHMRASVQEKINSDSRNLMRFTIPKPDKVLSMTSLEEARNKYLASLDEPDVRWDEEAQYFEMLSENDSFLYNKLIDKIKFFNPAFHSITPEGFNARLGFLHQCTRQGNTIGVSDGSYKTAGNLAFGAPPICVLRIGDFYNTKIIINSISIDYETPQWDMNPEGIGVQPMFAKISLNFVFLGGSDIEAPISRLQNALTFNYYANQSIYDDRADMGMYELGNNVIQGKPWIPSNS